MLSAMRRTYIGFIFQFHHLLPEFSATENIVLPQLIAGLRPAEARMRALELLDMMGLSERESHQPAQLSGASSSVRSEEHTSELQSLMRISYAVFCLKKTRKTTHTII